VFLWTLASFADFCNRCRRAGTPCRAVVPRTRVRLSPRYSLAPTDASCVGPFTRCRVGSRRAAHCTPRLSHGAFHLRRRGSCTGRSDREKVKARVLDESARTLLVTLRAPGSPVRFVPWVWKTWGLIAPAETLLGCSLAKGCTVERVEVPSAAPEPLRERRIAPPCAPGPRPRHSASEEALLGGTRAFFRPLEAPSSDEDGASSGLDPLNQGEPKPRWNDESQRPSRLLRPNQLAG